jgi:hypothetical protein
MFQFVYSNVDALWYLFGVSIISAVIAVILVNKKRNDDFFKSLNRFRKDQSNTNIIESKNNKKK